MGLTNNKNKLPTWLICPKCYKYIPIISKIPSSSFENIMLSFECICFDTDFQMPLNVYNSILVNQISKSNNEKVEQCVNCSSEEKCIIYCLECNGFLCDECYSNHVDSYMHNYSNKKIQISFKCLKHQLNTQYYCNTCEKEICFKCKGQDSDHEDHSISSLKDYLLIEKNKWTYHSYNAIPSKLNLPDKESNAILNIIRIMYSNIDSLIERPSLNLIKTITSFQKEITTLANLKIKNNQEDNHLKPESKHDIQIRNSIKMHNHYSSSCFDVQYKKPKQMTASMEFDFIINVLIQLSNGHYAMSVTTKKFIPTRYIHIIKSLETFEKLYMFTRISDDINILMEYSYDSFLFVSNKSIVEIWNNKTYDLINKFDYETEIISIVLIPKDMLLIESKTNKIDLWSIQSSQIIASFTEDRKYYNRPIMLLNDDVFISYQKYINIWSIQQKNIIMKLDEYRNSITFIGKINDFKIISCSVDGIIKQWNVNFDKSINTIELPSVIIDKGLIHQDKYLLYLLTNNKNIILFDYAVNQILSLITMYQYNSKISFLEKNRLCVIEKNRVYFINC